MQSTAGNLEFKLNVNLRLVKPEFMQSTAVNLEFKLRVTFKLLSCNRPFIFLQADPKCSHDKYFELCNVNRKQCWYKYIYLYDIDGIC